MRCAVVLLALDLLIALGLRGLLRPSRVGAAVLLLGLLAAPAAQALDSNPNPALATRLGYIVTGDGQLDGVSRAGLEGLSEYVNRRTAATLVEPDAVEPGKTDLSFYPLLYWPISADAQPLSTEQTAALNDYMSRGGIILIDTRDSGSGAGFAPGTGVGAAAGGAGPGDPAAGAADHRARAGARVLPAAGLSRALHRRARCGCSATRTAPTTASAR